MGLDLLLWRSEIRIIDTDFLDNGEDGVWMGEEAAAIESVSLVSVKAIGNAESGLEINVSGQVKLSAVTSENNGGGDVLP